MQDGRCRCSADGVPEGSAGLVTEVAPRSRSRSQGVPSTSCGSSRRGTEVATGRRPKSRTAERSRAGGCCPPSAAVAVLHIAPEVTNERRKCLALSEFRPRVRNDSCGTRPALLAVLRANGGMRDLSRADRAGKAEARCGYVGSKTSSSSPFAPGGTRCFGRAVLIHCTTDIGRMPAVNPGHPPRTLFSNLSVPDH